MTETSNEFLIFECLGGLAYDLMGTIVVGALKRKYPEHLIVVISTNPEIWLHNPDVWRVYKYGSTPYFYQEYIENKKSLVFRHNPRSETSYIYGTENIIDVWCKLCGVERPARGLASSRPQLHFTQREKEATFRMLGEPKNLFLIQSEDTTLPKGSTWPTAIPHPMAEFIVSEMNSRGFTSMQIGGHEVIRGALPVNLPLRQIFCAIESSKARLFIDSFANHVAAGFNLFSVVTWFVTNSNESGYEMHKNINANIPKELKIYMENIAGNFRFGLPIRPPTLDISSLYNKEDILGALTQQNPNA